MRSPRTRARIGLAVSLGTGLMLTGGVGAAMAGSLPGAAQDAAQEMLAKIGVDVPGADAHSAGNPDERGRSGDSDKAASERGSAARADRASTDSEERTPAKPEDAGAAGQGSDVSELAKGTEATGVEKGAEISDFASGGESQAGDHGRPEAVAADPEAQEVQESQGSPPVEAPNSGGTGTADDATSDHADGASSHGTDTADSASSGHSGAGSGNRP